MAGLLVLASLQSRAEPPPARGPTERVQVDLILVDVDVRDAAGRPIRGLTPADFVVKVNGVRRPVYSADDRCGCGDAAPPGTAAAADPGGGAGSPQGSAKGSAPAAPAVMTGSAPAAPARFIFYFDFSLLDLDGRVASINEARRWIQVTMRDGDQIMIVASTPALGAVTVAESTADRAALLASLDAMRQRRDLVDSYMPFFESRLRECREDHADPRLWRTLPHCNANAWDDYLHTRGALRTLTRFMQTLEPEGRKHLILFHQIATFKPADVFPGARLQDTQESSVQDVGAAAVASHVAIHAAGTDGSSEIGWLAAEYTGGTFNRGRADLSRSLDEAHGRCECLYRIGIEPLEKEKGRTVTLTVLARNRSIANMRVAVRTAADRWLQQARHLLSHPGAASDLPVRAGLLPIAAGPDGWTLKVQVALHASALTRLPDAAGSHAEWEAGARLEMEGAPRAWDMLAVSSMSARQGAGEPAWIMHERAIAHLPPGTYRLAAFVRDRSVDLFGSASATLVLPDPGSVAAVGPVPMLADQRLLVTDLPLQPAGREGGVARGASASSGLVPRGAGVTAPDEESPLEILTWLCGPRITASAADAAERSLRFMDDVVMTFTAPSWEQDGTCLRLDDRLEAGLLEDGHYRYHLRWRPEGGAPVDVQADLP